MDNALKYSFKVWLTNAIIASILSWLSLFFRVKSINDFIDGLKLFIGTPIMILLIAMFTIPCAAILYFSVRYLVKGYKKTVFIKMILTILGILFTTIYLYVLGGFEFKPDLFVMAPYYLAIIISIWSCKLKRISVDYRISKSEIEILS